MGRRGVSGNAYLDSLVAKAEGGCGDGVLGGPATDLEITQYRGLFQGQWQQLEVVIPLQVTGLGADIPGAPRGVHGAILLNNLLLV